MTICYYLDVSELCDAKTYDLALCLVPWEKRRHAVSAYRFMQDKRLSLGVGLLLRYALMRAGVADIRLIYGEYGKPALADRAQQVYFNCSHSGDLAVCVVSDSPVGVDVEKIAPVDERVTCRFFTPEEQRWIAGDERAFYRLWTRKESYMKLLGTGMMLPAQGICVLDDSPLLENCQFTEYAPDGYCLAVCGNECGYFSKMSAERMIGELQAAHKR